MNRSATPLASVPLLFLVAIASTGQKADPAQTAVWAFVWVIIGIFMYLVPTVVAARRKHHNVNAIAAVNILLGWTILGWIASLVWAVSNPAPRAEESRGRVCLKCGTLLGAGDRFCTHCGAAVAV